MTETVGTTAPPHVAPPHAPETDAPALATRPGRWIDHWNPEDEVQWATEGRTIARRNLRWSIFAEFLGFVVWQLWSIVAVTLPAAGFDLSTGEIFWLISIPSLVGAMPGASNTFFSLAAKVVVWSYCMAIRLRVSCLPTPASSAMRSPRSGADQELDSCMP